MGVGGRLAPIACSIATASSCGSFECFCADAPTAADDPTFGAHPGRLRAKHLDVAGDNFERVHLG